MDGSVLKNTINSQTSKCTITKFLKSVILQIFFYDLEQSNLNINIIEYTLLPFIILHLAHKITYDKLLEQH